MSDNNPATDVTSPAADDEVIDWKAKAAEYEAQAKANEAEAAKNRAKRKEAEAQVLELKKKVNPDNDTTKYLKEELEKVSGTLGKFAERAKGGAIQVAATSKLTAMGINPDALALAMKILDKNSISYDADTDTVDETELAAQLSKIKSGNPFLFETKISKPGYRAPADGRSAQGTDEIPLDDWKRMSAKEQRAAITTGKKAPGSAR